MTTEAIVEVLGFANGHRPAGPSHAARRHGGGRRALDRWTSIRRQRGVPAPRGPMTTPRSACRSPPSFRRSWCNAHGFAPRHHRPGHGGSVVVPHRRRLPARDSSRARWSAARRTPPRSSCTDRSPAPASATAPTAPSPAGCWASRPTTCGCASRSELAEQAGVAITFENTKLRGEHHPNTTRITVTRDGRRAAMVGSSIGAGRDRGDCDRRLPGGRHRRLYHAGRGGARRAGDRRAARDRACRGRRQPGHDAGVAPPEGRRRDPHLRTRFAARRRHASRASARFPP